MNGIIEKFFKVSTNEEMARFIAAHLPEGRAWNAKNDQESNVGRLLLALSPIFVYVEQEIRQLFIELDIYNTNVLIDKFEASVGLPDECTQQGLSLALRRQEVLARIPRKPVVTLQEYQDLIDPLFPGYTIIMQPAIEYYTFDYEFDFQFYDGGDSLRFILIVEVLEPMPQEEIDRLVCRIRQFLPANCMINLEATIA